MGEIRKANGIAPTTVAQIYRRPDGKLSFRYQDGRRYRYAKELVGDDDGWATIFDAQRVARRHGIRNSVVVTNDWDKSATDRRCA